MERVYNFGAGPSMFPLAVLKEVQKELLDYERQQHVRAEISHRSALYEKINDKPRPISKSC